jgi:hypothetical protein
LSGHTQPKRSKFKNIRTKTSDGVTHASKKEAARWLVLKEREVAGVIRDLERQIRFPLHVNGIRIGTYIPDFQYTVAKTGERITEDVKAKATVTPLYRRNKKHLFVEHSISVKEVYKWNDVVQ